jgi:hypothetical protein
MLNVLIEKFAVTLFAPFIVIVAGFAVPVKPPLQLEKLYPVAGDAVNDTTVPESYGDPAGFGVTVPLVADIERANFKIVVKLDEAHALVPPVFFALTRQ